MLAEDHVRLGDLVGFKAVAGCSTPESWGRSIYLLDGQRGIAHYIQYRDRYHQVRFIATDGGVTRCAVVGDALVFVDPAHGIYQTDRSIESDGEQLWIAATPIHYGHHSRFEMTGDDLDLVTGRLRDRILIDVAVRNDHVPELSAFAQLDLPVQSQRIGPPVAIHDKAMAVSAGMSSFLLKTSALVFEPLHDVTPGSAILETEQGRVVASLLADVLSVKLYRPEEGVLDIGLVRDSDAQGLCIGSDTLVSFDRDGQLRRYWLQHNAVEQNGAFQLTGEAVSCLVDTRLQRLYVIEKAVGIWVFNLADSGLSMPRAVTTDKMIESLSGLAVYDDLARAYLLSQSTGDGAFLVFSREHMTLLGRFRIVENLDHGVDGVRASRGFAASSQGSNRYPEGVLVVHDQRNRLPEAAENLKVVDWQLVEQLLNSSGRDK